MIYKIQLCIVHTHQLDCKWGNFSIISDISGWSFRIHRCLRILVTSIKYFTLLCLFLFYLFYIPLQNYKIINICISSKYWLPCISLIASWYSSSLISGSCASQTLTSFDGGDSYSSVVDGFLYPILKFLKAVCSPSFHELYIFAKIQYINK